MGKPAFGGGASDSVLHPAVLVAMLCAIALIFILPRRFVIVPLLLTAFLVPLNQQIYAAGAHWLVLRIIILGGLVRILASKVISGQKVFAGGFNRVDQAFFACVLSQVIAFVLLYNAAPQAVNYQVAVLVDFLGGYCLVRALIQTNDDIFLTLKWMAVIAIVQSAAMIREQLTLQNVFGLLGGVQAAPDIREGKIRSQGVFQHALTAGTLAATLLPLFFLLWKNGKARIAALTGMIGCTIMTICSNSSTSLMTYVAGVLGVCCWPVRRHMRAVRVGLVIVLVTLHLLMKVPVWFLIARIDLTGGSSGYHRAQLIDQFIKHFGDWWLSGTKEASNWGLDMWDQQNEFVRVGETGGIVALVMFIIMLSRSFARIGEARKLADGDKKEWLVWFLGAALFANIVGFLGVNYFDQSKIGWFALLAMIAAATDSMLPAQDPLHVSSDLEGDDVVKVDLEEREAGGVRG